MAEAFTPRFVDLVRNITTTAGTGNFTLGSPVSGFSSFAEAIQPGDRFYYSVIGVDRPTEREVGRGTMMPDATIKREPLAGATLTNFTAGTKTIALVAAAEWFEQVQAGGGNGGGSAGSVATRDELSRTPPALRAVVLRERGREGLFLFESGDLTTRVAADKAQGVYVPVSSDPSGASGAWVRNVSGALNPCWFGMAADDSSSAVKSANASALRDLLSYLSAVTPLVDGYYKGTTKVEWPRGDFHFAAPDRYFSVKSTAHFEGQNGGPFGGPATRLFFDKGGFLVEGPDTLNGAASALSTSGGGSRFCNLYMASIQARPAAATYGAEATSGILAYSIVFVENCWFIEFTRDGLTLDGGGTPGVATNVDGSIIRDCRIRYNGRHGVYLEGVDANACTLDTLDVSLNNNWGIYDSGFLGNHHCGHHASGNGVRISNSKHDGLTSVVCYPASSGTMYTVAPGRATAASSTEPGSDGSVWVAQKNGAGAAAPNAEAPLWVSGTAYKEGGSYFYDGVVSTAFVNCYAEAGQGQPFMGNAGIMLGGTWEKHPLSQGFYLNGSSDGFQVDSNFASTGNLKLPGFGKIHHVGPTSGVGNDVTTKFNIVGNGGHKIAFDRYNAGGTWQNELGYLWAVTGVGLFVSGGPSVVLRSGGTSVAEFNAAGLNLHSGSKLMAAGVEVPVTNAPASRLIGRGSVGGAGPAQEITLGSGLTMSGTVLSASDGGWTEITLSGDCVAANSLAFGDIGDGTNAFVYTPPANANFEIEAALLIETSTATNLPRIGVRVDAQGAGAYGAVQIDQTGSTGTSRVTADGTFTAAAVDVQMAPGGVAAPNTPYLSYVTVRGRSGAAPGPIRIQLACESAAANACRVRQGSQMRVKAS